jgi:uncharacterized membrane protein (DUF4010 family)
MEYYEPYISLGVAAVAGLLIGIEREQSAPRDKAAESFLGGARTHPLIAIAAALAMLISRQTGWPVVMLAFAALVGFLIVSYADDVRRGGERGLTSEAAFLVSFLLGALALTDRVIQPLSRKIVVVLAVAVVTTLLLSAKPTLNPVVRRLSREDVGATLKFLIVSVVVLPLLPDETIGPLAVLNPRQIGFMMVLIAGISFVGYAAIRIFGPHRGLGLTGLAGGLASSTAVTLSMAARSREYPRLTEACTLAVVLACSVMFVRVAVEVGVVNAALLPLLAWPLGLMAAAGLLATWRLYQIASRGAANGLALSNPFELSSAVKFALVFTLVLLGSKAASTYLGSGGAYAAGAVAGAADVDAISISMARLARDGLAPHVAATSIFLATASNTLVKACLAVGLGGSAFARKVALALGAMLVAGGVGVALAWRFA